MLAAWIAKRRLRSVFDKVGEQGDAESAFAKETDDWVYDIPLELSAGSTVKGKKAVIDWFQRWYAQFPKRKLIVKNVAFTAWPLNPANIFMVEWTCEETDKKGKEFRYDGVTITEMKKGRAVRTTEYIACKGLPQLSSLLKPVGKALKGRPPSAKGHVGPL
jgi:ketosteroid isomerase-like protein